MNKNRLSLLFIVVLVCALLSGCSSEQKEPPPPASITFAAGEFEIDTTTELSIVLQSGETQLLDQLPMLKSADFSGSECLDEIYVWAQEHPQVKVTYTITLPDGTVLDNSAKSVDFSAMGGGEIRSTAEMLRYLPELEIIDLGSERSGMGWEDIDILKQTCPEAKLKYVFDLYGKEIDLQNTQINLSHVPVNDGGAYVKQVMAYMPDLSYVDMDSCGVSNEDMASIRDSYPDVKVVWRIWFGDAYSVRTDVERILASKASVGGMLTPENTQALKYCTDVVYLDVGHNTLLTDISFVGYMPKLQVAILAMCDWHDASPLANCPELEYLEIQTTNCVDLSPLSGLDNLRHLDIAHIVALEDISPIYSLTGLERLWVGSNNYVPKEQIEHMRSIAPNCEINDTAYIDPTEGRWRYVDYNELAYMFILHPRYELLREQFGGYADDAFSFYWNDPLY